MLGVNAPELTACVATTQLLLLLELEELLLLLLLEDDGRATGRGDDDGAEDALCVDFVPLGAGVLTSAFEFGILVQTIPSPASAPTWAGADEVEPVRTYEPVVGLYVIPDGATAAISATVGVLIGLFTPPTWYVGLIRPIVAPTAASERSFKTLVPKPALDVLVIKDDAGLVINPDACDDVGYSWPL